MSIDIVRGELERLFSLDELTALSSDVLGFDPAQVGASASKASFARALTDRCLEDDAAEALVDAVLASRNGVDPRMREFGARGVPRAEELKPGEAFGPFTIVRKLGESVRAIVYSAKRDGHERTLKVYRREATRDASARHRFLTHVRLVSRVRHDNLPAGVEAGTVGRRVYVSYAPIDGQPLTARIQRAGPLHLNEAKALLHGILGGLGALHEARLCHGDVKPENVLIARGSDGQPRVVLVDAGAERLGTAIGALGVSVRTASPEQIRGGAAAVASDLYAFGATLFELLTGKPVFGGAAVDVAVAHLTAEPKAPSAVAPRGWVPRELDDLVARLLSKAPEGRPRDVAAVVAAVDPVGRSIAPGKAPTRTITEEQFRERVERLLADPADPERAIALESCVAMGEDPVKVAEALAMAAEQIRPGDHGDAAVHAREANKALRFRAARIYESSAKMPDRAEAIFAALLEADPTDEIVFVALEELRKSLGKHDELIEMLLERSEKSESHSERARALNLIGHLYCRELDDREQGVFALAQALAQDTLNDEYATDLERAAGTDMKLWGEALHILSQVSTHPRMPPEAKISLFTRLGHWYSDKIARPDLGLPCFQAVLSVDPAHAGALEGLTHVYRRAQQWQELGQVLLARADRAASPSEARDLRAEAADVLETKLNDPGRARDLYEQIFQEDPGHAKAAEALARIYQRLEDWSGYVRILERRAEALRGDARIETLCKIAELYEDQLNDLGEATRRYGVALDLDAQSLTALRGLDRIYNRTGRYRELLDNLQLQIVLAATPRQRINLYGRIAGIYDEEFLDHGKAAEALEEILTIDGAHEGALTALARHYRALDRWEDVVSLYDKHLRIVTNPQHRIELLLGMGRTLVERVGSPERACAAYERVLEIDSHHSGALESLAHVRATTGDAMAALSAIEALAAKAQTPEQRADLWIRAAKVLEEKGDKDGAIERYRLALDAQPANAVAAVSLRGAYTARGDAASAAELIVRQIETAEGNLAKARLWGELAQLSREKLKDVERARQAATKAVDLDPTSILGLLVTGDLAFETGRFLEATKSYESVASRVDLLPKDTGVRALIRYVDALAKSGSTEKATGAANRLLEIAPDDYEAIERAAKVKLDAGQHKEAADLFADLIRRFSDRLSTAERADAMLNLGLGRIGAGALDDAILPLMEAADLAPDAAAPIEALCKVYEAKSDWEEVVRIKTRRLDVVSGEERSGLLLEIGEVLATQIGDRTRAAKSYVAALDERPDDRKILTKLMQLYSEAKDWSKLVDVVVKLASNVDDAKMKAKYLHTAAIVTGRQIRDLDKAAELYDQVLSLDPTLDKAIAEAIDVRSEKGDHEGVERLLKTQLTRYTEGGETEKMLATFERLGALYKDMLGWMSEAIDAYEAAQTLDPDNAERSELLAALYARDPAQYLDKAVAAQGPILKRNPYKPDAYRLLRKLYTEAKRADAAWCICQALSRLNFAEPDEERFYRRMRADGPAAAVDRLSADDWANLVVHGDADPLLSAIFAVIEPAVLHKNGQPLEALGYQLAYRLDLALHPYPMSQTLNYCCSVLGMDPPIVFQNPNDPGGVQFLHARTPAIVLGAAALATEIPTQAAAFIAARHLTYYRPGAYLRHLVATGTGLRAWLFAAIKLIVPHFPVAKELEHSVGENLAVIDPLIVGPAREQLASAVTKLLQTGAIDLKKWICALDLTADRAGFVVANDLELAEEMIRASDEASASIPHKERVKELILYSASEEYFAVRRRMGIHIDS